MLNDFQAALNAIKTSFEIVRNIQKLNEINQMQQQAHELQNIILDLQFKVSALHSAYSSMQRRAMSLEQELIEINQFKAQIKQYSLHQTVAGALLYRFNDEPNNPVPPHYLCTHCANQNIKSILQPGSIEHGIAFLVCH